MEEILRKIVDKQAVIGFLGLGHTGLSLAHEFGTEGYKIVGYDIDTSKIESLKNRQSYLPFLPLGPLFYLMDEKLFLPTSNSEDLNVCDVLIIAVPTPLTSRREPNLSFLKSAIEIVGKQLRKGQLVIIQSTSFPGTTEEIALPDLEHISGLKVGKDFYLAHVPEREDAGNPQAVLSQIPRICGGVTRSCLILAKTLYEMISVKVHICSSPKIAEAAKTYENTFRLINIAFVDEMKIAFDCMGIDIWEVIEASSTKPFGFYPFYPGPGIGGECVPVDPLYLAARAREFGAPTSMIDLAAEINIKASYYIVQKVTDALNTHQKSLNGAKIFALGVTFKPDVGDLRESPALKVLAYLAERGANISYHDFYTAELPEHNLHSIDLSEEVLQNSDCVIILTNHSRYDWTWISQHSPLIVDTRGATRSVDKRFRDKIIY